MTAELRNLPHIASMAFNEPLMLEPAYARVFFCALAGQLGISRLTDAVSGDSLTAQEAPATLALSGDDDGPRQARSYQVMNASPCCRCPARWSAGRGRCSRTRG
ncbi:minor capsid protein C from bacteriophage origin [Escherichia coli]|uniref:Minor capsid protein C from bacteriophage origin n=1 Tax=Escherichia coli TaxID=562 RepID=A0A376S7X2_ECOLX|nr:minor capsid protein C from bacteriophage origin [Escherichia coli]